MKQSIKAYGLVLLFFIALSTISFRCAWGPNQVFSGSDCNIGLIASAHGKLPELFRGAYRSTPVFGSVLVAPFSLYNIGRWLLPPAVFSDVWYSVCLTLSSLFLVVFLRLWKLRWGSCLFGALAAFWVGSVTLCSAGHLNKLGVMMFFSLALLLVERAVRSREWKGRCGLSCGAGVATGMMLLEQQDVALFAGLFLGAYTLLRICQTALRKSAVWAGVLLPVAVIAMSMAGPTAAKSYSKNVTQTGLQKDPQAQWEFVTQWSMVPSEMPDFIAPGYTGWSTGNPKGPYWGKVGQSAGWETTQQGFENFRLDSLYLGLLPVCLAWFGLYAAFRARREDHETSVMVFCLAGLALIALLLSFGKFSLPYKLFFHLPLVGNIRAPIKLLHNCQVLNAIVAAYGVDQLLRREWRWRPLLVFLASLLGLFGLLALSVDSSRFAKWGVHAEIIARTVRIAWIHAAAMTLLLGGCLVLRWKRSTPVIQTVCACLLVSALAVDSLLLTKHYFKSENIAHLRRGNTVVDYLKEHQGNERIFFLDQSGVYNMWLGRDIYYHGLNVFNIWQMPRMPQEYKSFLAAAGNSQVRLWQLASVKYITAPASVLARLPTPLKSLLKPVFFYRFVRQGDGVGVQAISRASHKQDQVLLEFCASLPRVAMFQQWESMPLEQQCQALFAPGFDPLKTVLVDSATELPLSKDGGAPIVSPEAVMDSQSVLVRTDVPNASLLLFTQRYQSEWRVLIDGETAELLHCNYLNMGVLVPEGSHTVEFLLE